METNDYCVGIVKMKDGWYYFFTNGKKEYRFEKCHEDMAKLQIKRKRSSK